MGFKHWRPKSGNQRRPAHQPDSMRGEVRGKKGAWRAAKAFFQQNPAALFHRVTITREGKHLTLIFTRNILNGEITLNESA